MATGGAAIDGDAVGIQVVFFGVAAQPPVPADSSLPDSVRRVEKETGGEVLRAEPIQALVASDLSRALQTAAPLAQARP